MYTSETKLREEIERLEGSVAKVQKEVSDLTETYRAHSAEIKRLRATDREMEFDNQLAVFYRSKIKEFDQHKDPAYFKVGAFLVRLSNK